MMSKNARFFYYERRISTINNKKQILRCEERRVEREREGKKRNEKNVSDIAEKNLNSSFYH